MRTGLLAEMGAVGTQGGLEKADRSGRKWTQGPRGGGQGEGLERVSGSLSTAPGPQDSSLTSQDTSRVCPPALFTPHRDLLAAPH